MTLIDKDEALAVLRKAQVASCTCQIKTPDPEWHNHNCRYRILREAEAMIDHLPDAALPAAVPGVKPLEWHEGDEPDEWKSGPYDVWCEIGKFQLYYWSIVLGAPHETADAAKAAAYAHHRARILSALAPSPARDVRQAALREAVKAGMRIAMETPIEQVPAAVDAAILALIDKPATDARDVRETLENEEQLHIWAQESLEGLGFADVLKIESYEDKIEAHSIIGRGIVEVLRSLIEDQRT